jgi:type VI secretion system protein ImpF
MHDPRPARRIRAPLFERLTKTPEPARELDRPFRSLAITDAVESVRKELHRLLNTRTVLQPTPVAPGTLTTINYGLPDFSHISATDMQGRAELAQRLARIIENFEPRLSQVRVTVEPHPSGQRFLTGAISALLQVGVVAEPVAFPLQVIDAPAG